MNVWTKKAEDDYKAKWPDKPCKRIAGQEIEYCGSTRVPGSIVAAYFERGWVETAEPVVIETRGGKGLTRKEIDKVFERRWKVLQNVLSQESIVSVQVLAHSIGLATGETLTNFIRKHGEELAEKYGKLPNFKPRRGRGLSTAWTKVMK